jgi:disulfide bond formation protein DsbB
MPCPVTTCCNKILTMPLAAKLILAACFAALGFVLVMQYGFLYQPCILCLWQRAPYGLASFLSLVALLWRPFGKQSAILLFLCAALFVCGFGLAVFHSGVELHWWVGTSSCSIQPLHGASPEDLRQALLHTVTARCDEVVWTLFGLSMANYNIALSLLLAFYATASGAKVLQE